MSHSEVGLSRTLSKEDVIHCKMILRELKSNVHFSREFAVGQVLRIATAHEVFDLHSKCPSIFTITPRCLSQMRRESMNPFSFPLQPRPLVNLWLYRKTVSLTELEGIHERLEAIIELMGGSLKEGTNVDFVIAIGEVKLDSGACLGTPAWLEALYASEFYQRPIDFLRASLVTPRREISSLSQGRDSVKNTVTRGRSQKARRGRLSGPRQVLALVAELPVGQQKIQYETVSKTPVHRNNIPLSQPHREPLRKSSIPMRDSLIEEFMDSQDVTTTQTTLSSQKQQICNQSSSSEEYDDDCDGELQLSRRKGTNLIPAKSPYPPPTPHQNKVEVDADKTVVGQNDKVKRAPALLERLKTDLEHVASSDELSDDEEGKVVLEKGKKEGRMAKFDDLCDALMRGGSKKPSPFENSEASVSESAWMDELTEFSQIGGRDDDVVFNVEYKSGADVRPILDPGGGDPLLELCGDGV
jgi:hypothetical protein